MATAAASASRASEAMSVRIARRSSGGQVAAEFADLAPVGGEEDRRRPAPVPVTIGEIGVLVDVDADGDEALAQEIANLGIEIRCLVHDMAPVAPLGRSVEEQVFAFAAGALEGLGRPRGPGEGALPGALPRGGDVDLVGRARADDPARRGGGAGRARLDAGGQGKSEDRGDKSLHGATYGRARTKVAVCCRGDQGSLRC